jgi:uncharacterized membrane protein YgcG
MNVENQHIEDKLDDALAMVAAGIPVDVVLAEAGPDAEWLAPMLAVAGEAAQMKAAIPVPPPAASLNRMLAHAESLAPAAAPIAAAKTSGGLFGWFRIGPLFATGFRAASMAAMVMVAFLAGTVIGTGVTMAAQNSLPGQPFYGLKRMGETIRLNLTGESEHRQKLEDTFNLERQYEADLLLDQGKEITVVFEDTVHVVSDTSFTIDGMVVNITSDTEIFGELASGARVRIEAITQPPNNLQALIVTVIQAAPPTPAAAPLPTIEPTQTPAPTATRAQDSDIIDLPQQDDPALPVDDEFTGTDNLNADGNTNSSVADDAFNDNSDDDNANSDDDDSNDNSDDDNANSNDDDDFDSGDDLDDDFGDTGDNSDSGDDLSGDDDFNDNDDDFDDEFDDADDNSDSDSSSGSSDDSSDSDNSGSGSSGSDNSGSGSDDSSDSDSSGSGSSDDDNDDDDDDE